LSKHEEELKQSMDLLSTLKSKYGDDHPILSKINEDSFIRDPTLKTVIKEYSDLLYYTKVEKNSMKKDYSNHVDPKGQKELDMYQSYA
jgi:hypothetical protein